MMGLRRAIAGGGTMQFEGYGDLSLAELIPAVLTRYSETELLIAAPSLPDQAAEALLAWMKKTWARMDGKGNLWRVQHLTIVTDLSAERSPLASLWLEDNPLGERLTLVNKSQPDTAILLPDFAITGPVNMQYSAHFVAEATTDMEKVRDLWKLFLPKEEKKDAPAEAPVEKTPADAAPEEAPADAESAQEPAGDAEPAQDDKPAGRKKAARKV